ncbi:hypothetical protein [Paenibacillus aestuarii]|uniref:Lycopene cyclase domain-containing protein n=1 Tax=Paenibacillus aestuarii TaxID=516965 RepID=A0ABW0KJ61_9BACL|nr:hypothetical protein [Paenibacillus aestuarii]
MEFILPYFTFIIALFIIWFMPKYLSRREIYITWGWMAALTVYTDLILGVIFDLYDFGNEPAIDFFDLPLQATLAPSAAIIILNFMPRSKKSFILYLVAVVLFSIFYEWLCTLTGYIVPKGWKLWYSAPFYLLGTLFIRWHLFFLRKKS